MADNTSGESYGKDITDILKQFDVGLSAIKDSSESLAGFATQINATFTQGRQRIYEISKALADATPNVRRLGGDIEDVSRIISEVALESRRNVIANTEDVEKLYAAEQVLGQSAQGLTKSFLDIGTGIERIPEILEDSIDYVQSIGGNAKAVMSDVSTNMEKMNRYQFDGGVKGLTKMAAQASMLRFDMNQTFQLADKVLDPEGAIEVAAAFQRLGVSAGNLTDPLALINSSINDPGAIQDGLVNIAKSYASFDEKTKTFKMNPQGVLTLREMEKQTGVSAAEMSKLALSALEADKRISQLNSANLSIVNEEDKQYLANIAKMNKETGKYEVTLEDNTKKELSELTQPEFNRLIELEKERPKNLEDIARTQMDISKIIQGDVGAIRAKVVGGLVSTQQLLELREGIRRGGTTITGELSKVGGTEDARKQSERAMKDFGSFISDMKDKNVSFNDALDKYKDKLKEQFGETKSDFKKSMIEAAKRIENKSTDKTAIERLMNEGMSNIRKKLGVESTPQKTTTKSTKSSASSFIEGRQTKISDAVSSTTKSGVNSEVEIKGDLNLNVNLNGNAGSLTPSQSKEISEQIAKEVNYAFNGEKFKSLITNITTKRGLGAPLNPTYNNV